MTNVSFIRDKINITATTTLSLILAIPTFNQYSPVIAKRNKISVSVIKGLRKDWKQWNSVQKEAIEDRIPDRFPKLSSAGQKKLAQVVKRKGQIDSKLYVYLGNLYDKLKNPKKFEIVVKKINQSFIDTVHKLKDSDVMLRPGKPGSMMRKFGPFNRETNEANLTVSREDRLKEQREHAKQSPFKLKSEQYPRAIAINTDGFGHRHATVEDIISACDSFGMIIDKELQVEQIQKQLGKKGFISYNKSELEDVFEERETERMILALESDVEEQEPTKYTQGEIAYAELHEHEIEFLKPDGQKAKGPILKMSGNTFNIKDKYTGKSFTYKYSGKDVKIEEEEVKTFKQIAEAANASISVTHKGGNISKMTKQFNRWVKFSHEGPSKYKFTGSKDKIEMIKKYIDTGKLGKSSYQKWPNEENIKEVTIGDAGIRKDFPNVWTQKDKKMNNILMALVNRDGYSPVHSSYLVDKKKFVDSLKKIGKNDASLKKAGLTKREIGEEIQEGRFSKQLIKQAGGIAFDKRYYMGNMSGAVKAIEKLKKGLSDDPKVKDMLRIANESAEPLPTGTATDYTNWLPEGGDKEAYQKFFKKALKKFGVNSPDELEGDKKKEFFDYVDKNWKGDHEEVKIKLDGRRKNFREKMKKLGYIKGT